MCNVARNVIPVIRRATGTTSRLFRKYLSNILGKHEIRELQKQLYWALYTYFLSTKLKIEKFIVVNINTCNMCRKH